jgi:hypothetical protein
VLPTNPSDGEILTLLQVSGRLGRLSQGQSVKLGAYLADGLSNEARNKLERARPHTVGQAGRLDGITPAALGILAAYLRREARKRPASA